MTARSGFRERSDRDSRFGTSWRSDPARDFTAILLTQREFESPTSAHLYNAFERAARP